MGTKLPVGLSIKQDIEGDNYTIISFEEDRDDDIVNEANNHLLYIYWQQPF